MTLMSQPRSSEQRRLVKLFGGLSGQDKATLLAFAEFLGARQDAQKETVRPETPEEPKSIPRPGKESVVGAIRRLSESYFMLDRQSMLSDTASLMTANVIHGRPAKEVVDELEAVFKRHYQAYLDSFQG